MSESSSLCPPLLVRIQSIDITNLDFQCGTVGTSKTSRHITYVEATNLFLFVGCTSGTVYVFSRESLKFMFIIPFKGGKVCNIAASLDESDVAIASIRGRVSLYRISPNVHYILSKQQQSPNASPGEAFRHLYDIPFHVKSEITEIQWSPNGKYLFVGDSQGVISEVDVASLEEFPRPPASRIILKLQSRILQIDCTFPYMGICTLDAVYLCDLEKENFTRIQNPNTKCDIKSTGLSLMVLPERNQEETLGKMKLFVGEICSCLMYRCDLDGTILEYKKIDLSPGITNSVTLFDPKDPEVYKKSPLSHNSSRDLNYSLGKMLSTDDGLLVSVSNDRIFVYDPFTMNIILWNEDYNRINSFKIIANYGFVWYGNKLDVLAFTNFCTYGKQLFKAGLTPVLQSWINYAIQSVGWNYPPEESNQETNNELQQNIVTINSDQTELISELIDDQDFENLKDSNQTSISLFRKLIYPLEEDDEFCIFVSRNIPFELFIPKVEPEEEETEAKILEKALNKLISVTMHSENSEHCENFPSSYIFNLIESFKVFYSELGASLPYLQCKKSELTLSKVLLCVQSFSRQPQLVNLQEDIINSSIPNVDFQKSLEEFAIKVLQHFCKPILLKSNDDIGNEFILSQENQLCFNKYSHSPVVIQYFKDLGIFPENLHFDSLLADIILLLKPLISEDIFIRCLENLFKIEDEFPHLFFTWMIASSVVNKCLRLPYGSILRNLQNERFFDKLVEEVFITIYRDAISSVSQQVITTVPTTNLCTKYFHHFVTFIVLFSKSLGTKPRGVNLLLISYPIKRGAKRDVIETIVQICSLNSYIFKMLHKACLEDGNSMKLCECGIQACYGSLDDIIPPYQRAIEEAILSILIENYIDSQVSISPTDTLEDETFETRTKELLKNPMHQFAMRRSLIEPYMENDVSDEVLPDNMKLLVILRSGACCALKHVKFNLENLKIIKELTRVPNKTEESCSGCNQNLLVYENRKPLSKDCIGVWMVENAHTIDKFMNIVKKMGLNFSGEFSLRFYRFIIKRDHLRKNKKEDAGFGDLVSLSSLTCSVLH